MSWDIVLKIAGPLAAGVGILLRRGGPHRTRAAISDNLNLLQKLPREHAARQILDLHITNLTWRLAHDELDEVARRRDLTQVGLSFVWLLGFGYWTWKLYVSHSHWFWLTGLATVLGVSMVANDLQGRRPKKESAGLIQLTAEPTAPYSVSVSAQPLAESGGSPIAVSNIVTSESVTHPVLVVHPAT
ncbi:hypothetical protein [Frankia sp. Cas3]|uniref:hypothetical protein n=1 Tax=Frankia sp. Cas3 TaxID=3073926 RepID=UPI002AD5A09B|nr:hypothetical protein [Frankia sp. Cas3]